MNLELVQDEKAVTVAIIDCGINTSVSDLNKYVIKSTGFHMVENGIIIEDHKMDVKNEHGTLIALIIRDLYPDVKLISINILNEKLVTDGSVLLYAMNEAISYKPDIIHLSLGTRKWRYIWPLRKLVKKSLKNNIAVVAASDNRGRRSYPAFLKKCIGVRVSSISNNKNHYYYKDKFFFAPFNGERINGVEELSCRSAGGTSIAAAYITGHLARIKSLQPNKSINKVINSLHKNGEKAFMAFSENAFNAKEKKLISKQKQLYKY